MIWRSYDLPSVRSAAGLFDALFPLEILELVADGLRQGHTADLLAAALADGGKLLPLH